MVADVEHLIAARISAKDYDAREDVDRLRRFHESAKVYATKRLAANCRPKLPR